MSAVRTMTRYGFRIRTRSGMQVDNLMIHGRDLAEAQRKLEQMYHHCEILEARTLPMSRRNEAALLHEAALSLTSK